MPMSPFSEARALLAELLEAGHAVTAGAEGTLVITMAHALGDVHRAMIAFHKGELLALLFENTDDDRVACRDCFHLEHAGNCAAAARGRMRGVPRWYLPPRDVLWRCHFFCPLPGAGARAVVGAATAPAAGACAVHSAP